MMKRLRSQLLGILAAALALLALACIRYYLGLG